MASIGGVPPTVKEWAVHVDGVGQFGMAKDFEPPKLKEKVEKLAAGALVGEVNVPMRMLEALESKVSFVTYNKSLLRLWAPKAINGTILTLRAAQMAGGGAVEAIEIRMRGGFRDVEMDKFERGKLIGVPMSFHATAYKFTMEGDVIYDIDVEEPKWIVGDEDYYADLKDALGI